VSTTSQLAIAHAERRRDRIVHDPSVDLLGASRPSAVRALLGRSITMTALALELRVRTRRRKPDTEVRLESLLRRQWQADHVRNQRQVAELWLAATGPGPR
jgi:hypothetical protein